MTQPVSPSRDTTGSGSWGKRQKISGIGDVTDEQASADMSRPWTVISLLKRLAGLAGQAYAAILQLFGVATPNHQRDTNNEQVTPLGAGEVFEGQFTRVDQFEHFEYLYAAVGPFTAQKIWSADGVNALDRSVSDGVLDSTETVRSATAAFTQHDRGSVLSGTGIPAGARIVAVVDAQTVTLDQAATATASGVALTLASDYSPSTIAQQVVTGYNVAYDLNEGRNIAPYYKIRITNGATPQSAFPNFISIGWLMKTAYQGSFGTLSATVNNLSRALLTHSVQMGQQPDGDYVNTRADGTAYVNTDALGPNEVLESDWIDTDGWAGVDLTIATDQVSASDGIEIEFTGDIQFSTPVVRARRHYTFSAADVANGFISVKFPVALDGIRIRYTNGGTQQGSFFLQMDFRLQGPNPQGSLEQILNATNIAMMVRGLIAAKNDAGIYGNILRATGGGLRIAVNQHEADTPIKNLVGISGGTASISVATKIVDASAVPAGTRTIVIQAGGANNQILYLSNAAASASVSGGLFELDAGQAFVVELGDGLVNDIWAAPASGSQRYRVCYLKNQ